MKFDEPTVRSILNMISKHIPYKKACLANGVSERVFYIWIANGERDLSEGKCTKYTEFLQSLNKIEADRIEQHINKIDENGNGHKGSQWILERVFWKYFSAKAAEMELNERVEALENKKADVNENKTSGSGKEERITNEESSKA
jgi:hypothetical protein